MSRPIFPIYMSHTLLRWFFWFISLELILPIFRTVFFPLVCFVADPREIDELREGHPLRAAREALPEHDRRRHPLRLHRGRHVRDPRAEEDGDREGDPLTLTPRPLPP